MNQRMASSPFKIILLLVLLTPLLVQSQQQGGRKKTPGSQLAGKRNERKQGPEVLTDNPELIWGAPETDRIKGSLIIPDGSTARIEYSTLKQAKSTSTILLQGRGITPVSVELKGLLPAEKYVYRLFLKRAGEAAFTNAGEGAFYTAKPSGQSFEFTIQGDSHPERVGKMFNPALYRATLDSLTRTGTSFHFLMGDDFNADRLIANGNYTTEQVERIYRLQRSYLGRIGSNPPYFFVNGNHEQAALHWYDGTDTNIAVLATRAKKKFFALADPGAFYSGDTAQVAHIGLLNDYYAFEWGDALFVVIDPYWHSQVAVDHVPGEGQQQRKDPWGITLGKVQYDWFRKTLESSKARFKFVFAHHVSGTGRGGVERAGYFEWGGYSQNGQWQFDQKRPGWGLPIHALMVKNKVAVFFQGHDHLYARQEKDGIIYQTVPNPADDTYTAFNKEAYASGIIQPCSGFLGVKVQPDRVTITYHRIYLPGFEPIPGASDPGSVYTINR